MNNIRITSVHFAEWQFQKRLRTRIISYPKFFCHRLRCNYIFRSNIGRKVSPIDFVVSHCLEKEHFFTMEAFTLKFHNHDTLFVSSTLKKSAKSGYSIVASATCQAYYSVITSGKICSLNTLFTFFAISLTLCFLLSLQS